jgi:hypothetical protein
MSKELLLHDVPLDKLTSNQLYDIINWLGEKITKDTPLQQAVMDSWQSELLVKIKQEKVYRKA